MKKLELQPDEYLAKTVLPIVKTATPHACTVMKTTSFTFLVNAVRRLMKKPNESANYRSEKPRLKNAVVTARWESILGTAHLKRL